MLRSCIVSNKYQSLISYDLGLPNYIITRNDKEKRELFDKEKADLMECEYLKHYHHFFHGIESGTVFQ